MNTRRHKWISASLIVMLLASILSASPAWAASNPAPRVPPVDKTLNRVKTQVIVRFESDVSATEAANKIKATGGAQKKALGKLRLANYSTAAAAAKALDKFAEDSTVAYAFYNQQVQVPGSQVSPNLTRANPLRQGPRISMQKDGPVARLINKSSSSTAPAAAPAATGGTLSGQQWALDRVGFDQTPAPTPQGAPVVAVIDTGLDYTHPDLDENYLPCPQALADAGLYCDVVASDNDPMDVVGHGTHVAGIIAAEADDTGVTGVSPHSKILPVRIFDADGFTDLITIYQALDYVRMAKSHIPDLRVANMSWGGLFQKGSYAHQEFNARLAAVRNAGILPVAAAGNDSDFYLQAYPMILGIEVVDLPGMSPSVLGVAATDQNDYRTFFSNYSTPIKVNNCTNRYVYDDYGDYYECAAENTYTTKTYNFAPLAAPGWDVLAPATSGQHVAWSGTSMASPMVAGAAARIMAATPSLSHSQVAARMKNTGVPLGPAKGFPITTSRLDLARALGVVSTGFTGRVVDGISGQPLRDSTVTLKQGGALIDSDVTDGSGFYILTGATGGTRYTIEARKSTPKYVTNSRTAVAVTGQQVAPDDLSLAPARSDGAYTIMLEWKNVYTGIYEWELREYWIDWEANKKYPWPVGPASMPFSLMDSYFGVPFPNELTDSVEFDWWNRGSLNAFPYARFMHDSEFDARPHEAVVVRRLPVTGSLRHGIKWFAPGGSSRPGAVVTVYKNSTQLRRSVLAQAAAPTDGTRGDGRSEPYATVWALYNLTSGGTVSTAANNANGLRTGYHNWIHRYNDIPGRVGPTAGGKVQGRLEVSWNNDTGIYAFDWIDMYHVNLQEGKTYTFALKGPAGTDFDLLLWGPKALSINTSWDLDGSWNSGSNEKLTYRVPMGKGGRYYIGIMAWDGTGNYTLSRP